MPRTTQSFEQRVLSYFRSATLGEARLVHKLAADVLKERADEPTAAPAPKAKAANGAHKAKPAARSKVSGKKATKKKASRAASAGASSHDTPGDDEMPI